MGKRSREKGDRLAARQNFSESEPKSKFEFQTNREKVCLFVITWGAYLAMFVPLIILTQFFFPFVAPKTTIFRMVVEIIFAAYLFLVFSNSQYRPRINPLTIALTIFLAVFILSSLFGINLGRSFWSTYERMTGIWTMLHLYALFIVLSSCFKKREDWEKLLGVSVMAGVFLSLYVLKGNEISTRGGGTIGNTSFMAAYLLFDIFFAVILLFSNLFKKGYHSLWQVWLGATYALIVSSVIIAKLYFSIPNKFFWFISVLMVAIMALITLFGKRVSSLFWQLFAGFSLIPMLWILFISSARGAIAFFWTGISLMILGYFLFSRQKLLKRGALVLILLLLLLAIFAAILPPDFLTSKMDLLLYEMRPRFTVWQIGFEAWQARPLLGWGPENFNAAFSRYFNPCLFMGECGGEIWFDRVHNIVLDMLATTGLVGLLSYLAVFGVAISGLFRILPKVVERRNLFIPLGIGVLLLVYFAQNLLVFDMINTYLVFFLSLAFINFLIASQKEEQSYEIKRSPVHPVLGLAIITLTVFFLWMGNIKPLSAGHNIVASISAQNMEKSVESFQKSLDSWMDKYEAREYFSQKISRTASQSIPQAQQQEFYNALELAIGEMEKSIKENYLDFRPHLFLGQLYTSSYRLSGDRGKLVKAEQVLEEAIQLSPTNQQGYWNLAEVKLMQGKTEEMISLLKKAIDLEPRWTNSYWYLVSAYRIVGQPKQALEVVGLAEKAGYNWRNNLQDLKTVINLYLALADDGNLVPLYLRAIELEPNDPSLWASLAASYANLGQFDKAREAAAKVLELNPDDQAKIEEFLKTLPQ